MNRRDPIQPAARWATRARRRSGGRGAGSGACVGLRHGGVGSDIREDLPDSVECGSARQMARLGWKDAETEIVTFQIVSNGEIIEEYHEDYRCPAVLLLGHVRGIAHHIVVAICQDRLIVVTVYLPNEDEWINDRRRK